MCTNLPVIFICGTIFIVKPEIFIKTGAIGVKAQGGAGRLRGWAGRQGSREPREQDAGCCARE